MNGGIHWRLCASAAAALIACHSPSAPFPSDAVPFTPGAEYRTWWAEVEACAARTSDFASVRWFALPEGRRLVVDGHEYYGLWFKNGNRIVLTYQARHAAGEIAHEMLHAVLQRSDHPAEYFTDRCGAVVDCSDACRAGAR